jgi:hypothetical protein
VVCRPYFEEAGGAEQGQKSLVFGAKMRLGPKMREREGLEQVRGFGVDLGIFSDVRNFFKFFADFS